MHTNATNTVLKNIIRFHFNADAKCQCESFFIFSFFVCRSTEVNEPAAAKVIIAKKNYVIQMAF